MRAPALERGRALFEIGRLVVDTGDPSLVPAHVSQDGLDHVRRHVEALMERGRKRAAEIVQNPTLHMMPRLGDPGVELGLTLRPALESTLRAIAKDVIPGRPIRARPPRLDGQERERPL